MAGMLLDQRIPVGYLWQQARADAVTVLVISTVIAAAVTYKPQEFPPLPISVPAFLGTAISLILSFKLNQSYDRWWEARKIWGAIVNDSRSLARQLLTFPVSSADTTQREIDALARRMVRRQIAWCYALGQSLRDRPWHEGTVGHLDDGDIEEAERHANKPLALIQQHARDLETLSRLGVITDFRRLALDEMLTRLTDSMGKAERIRSTVFPTTYRMFLHVFIYVFITSLSIALEEVQGGWQIAITSFIAIPFFLLEKTATHLQDPFSNRPTDTPVTTIARTIEINLLQLLNEPAVPPRYPPKKFYAE